MKNIKLILEYDGTNYMGWQKQPKGETIQGTVENAISKITGEKVEVIGCSRTDSKVHAKGYVCNFKTSSNIPVEKFREALNHVLPEDISVIKSSQVHDDFHARYDSKGKMYCYTILNAEVRMPICRNFSYHYKKSLDIGKMKDAAKFFIGTHDFEAFRNIGSSVKTTTRTISKVDIVKNEHYIKVYIAADGFLYNMARIMIGTLIDAGNGKIKAEDIPKIILSRDRKKAGKTCSPQGLCLIEVYY